MPPDVQLEAEDLGRQIDSLQKRRNREIKLEYRRDYFERIHDEEMARQLSKAPAVKYVEPVVCHQLPERTQAQEVMCDLSQDLGPSDAARGRVRAIDCLIALSYRKEAQRPKPSTKACPESSLEQTFTDDPFPLVCKKAQCIICIGDVRGTIEFRTRTFSTPHKMMNHVDKHLEGYPKHKMFRCSHPKCVMEKLVLKDIEQFKLHVVQVHKIMLRP